MAKPKQDEPAASSKRRSITVWATPAEVVRIKAAVDMASKRTGFKLTVSTWMSAQMMRGVEEEERLSGVEEEKRLSGKNR